MSKKRSAFRAGAGAALLVLQALTLAEASAAGSPRTPALAWSSWNSLACGITEANLAANVDGMVALGLVQLGFTGFHIDECVFRLTRRPGRPPT